MLFKYFYFCTFYFCTFVCPLFSTSSVMPLYRFFRFALKAQRRYAEIPVIFTSVNH
jgi:hypothetical protein